MSERTTNDKLQDETLNLFAESFNQNPYPTFEKLRTTQPLYKTVLPDGQNAWIITRYEDAVAALKENRFVKDLGNVENDKPAQKQMSIISKHMLSSDPPDHRRLRGLVQQAFTPRKIERLRGRVEEITNSLLDQIAEERAVDLIDSFAFPLPIMVICELLGVPKKDRDQFRDWSNHIVEAANDAEQIDEVHQDVEAFVDYLQQWIAERRSNPQDDMISDLIMAEQEGDKLSEQELYSLVFLLLIAGHETTVNLIGNGVLALLEHPQQKAVLQNDLELIKNAIEEFLRYNGPVEFSTNRWASEDVEFLGKTIPKGDIVLIALDSASRDPEKFSGPNELDLTRQPNRHLAFGKGMHFCLGAPLARLEAEIAISTLLRRMPDIRLNTTFESL